MATVEEIEQALVAKGWARAPDGVLVLGEDYYHEDKYGRPYVLRNEMSIEVYSHGGKIYGARFLVWHDEEGVERDDRPEDLECSEEDDSSKVADDWHGDTACLIP